MALNPQIPLMVRPPVPAENPLALMRDVMAVKDDMATIQEKARQLASTEAMRRAMAEVGPDKAKRPLALQKMYQVDPLAAEELRRLWDEQDVRETNARTAQERTEIARLQRIESALKSARGPIRQAVSQMSTPEGWNTGRQMLTGITRQLSAASGMDLSGMIGQVPETYDTQFYDQIRTLPEWGNEVEKNVTAFSAVYQGFYDRMGRTPNDTEAVELAKQVAEAQARGTTDPLVRVETVEGNERVQKWVRQSELEGQTLPSQPTGQSSSPEDTARLAQQLVDGRLVPSQLSKRTANYNEILSLADKFSLEQTGKPYNPASAQVQYGAATRFVSSLNGPQQVRFRGLGISVVNTIDEIKALADEMNLSGITFANRLELEAKLRLLGNTEQGQLVARYIGAVNTLKEEFANLINGGYAPTEAAFALANRQINENYGAKAMHASLNEVQKLINFRLHAFEQITPAGVAPSSPFFDTTGRTPTPTAPATAAPPAKRLSDTRFQILDPSGTVIGEWNAPDKTTGDRFWQEQGGGQAATTAAPAQAPTASAAPPANPKEGDTWMSPTGLVTFQGKGKGWK